MPYKCKFFGGLGMGDEPVDACRNFRASEWVCPYAETWTFHKCEYRWMPTNADRIRSMTDEELAQYMGDVQTWGGCPNHGARNCTENCADCWLDWLKQEVTDNSTT